MKVALLGDRRPCSLSVPVDRARREIFVSVFASCFVAFSSKGLEICMEVFFFDIFVSSAVIFWFWYDSVFRFLRFLLSSFLFSFLFFITHFYFYFDVVKHLSEKCKNFKVI